MDLVSYVKLMSKCIDLLQTAYRTKQNIHGGDIYNFYFKCFTIVPVYAIRGTDIQYFFSYYMFRPDVAIFRYAGSHNHLFLFLLLSLHWPVF
jgi:hypothetical protein